MIKYENELNTLQLMIAFTRGKLYYGVKIKSTSNFNKTITDLFLMSSKHAGRHIKFYLNVLKYTRLIVCNKSFSSIDVYMKDN